MVRLRRGEEFERTPEYRAKLEKALAEYSGSADDRMLAGLSASDQASVRLAHLRRRFEGEPIVSPAEFRARYEKAGYGSAS